MMGSFRAVVATGRSFRAGTTTTGSSLRTGALATGATVTGAAAGFLVDSAVATGLGAEGTVIGVSIVVFTGGGAVSRRPKKSPTLVSTNWLIEMPFVSQ